MRAVVQRVSTAVVRVDGTAVAETGPGLLALVGLRVADTVSDLEYIANKILGLRVFEDENGVMNRSLGETGGDLLLVSQFTLYGDARKGRRPSYSEAMAPEKAAGVYQEFVELCRGLHPSVRSGRFGADMKIELVNEGPVTILLDSGRLF